MVEILSSEWAEQRLSYEVMTDLAGAFSQRCLSSIKPFISIRSAANNQREVPVPDAETGAFSQNLSNFWTKTTFNRSTSQQMFSRFRATRSLKRTSASDEASCTDSSLCNLGTSPHSPPPHPPLPLTLIKHMALATYVGTAGPSTVFEPIFDWLRDMWWKPPSLRDAAFDGFYLVECNNVCLSHLLVLRNHNKIRIILNPLLWCEYMSHTSSRKK